MNRFPLKSVLCIFIGLLTVQACAQNSVKLEYKFTPGKVLRYEIIKKETSTGSDKGYTPSDGDWSGILTLNVEKVLENGDAEIKASYESVIIQAPGAKPRQIVPGEVKVGSITITVSNKGVIRDIAAMIGNTAGSIGFNCESPEASGKKRMIEFVTDVYRPILSTLWPEFPKKEVKQGDTWKQGVRPPSCSGTATVKSKLNKINDKYNGYKAVSIIRSINDKSPAGTIDDKSNILFSLDKGQIIYLKNSDKMQMRGVLVDFEDEKKGTMDVNWSGSTEISLLPAGKDK